MGYMKKILTGLAIAVLIGVIMLAVAWPYVKMEFASSAQYTELDKQEYEYYTPALLKQMPRISHDYEFRYANISGPQAFVYSIEFKGFTDASKIRDYLSQAGYQLQKSCDIEAECWISSHSKQDIVTLNQSLSLQIVGVDIYRRPNKEQ